MKLNIVYKKEKKWFIGHIQEYPDYESQGKTVKLFQIEQYAGYSQLPLRDRIRIPLTWIRPHLEHREYRPFRSPIRRLLRFGGYSLPSLRCGSNAKGPRAQGPRETDLERRKPRR